MLFLLKKKKQCNISIKIIREKNEYDFEYIFLQLKNIDTNEYFGTKKTKLPPTLNKEKTIRFIYSTVFENGKFIIKNDTPTLLNAGIYEMSVFGKTDDGIRLLDNHYCEMNYFGFGLISPGENNIIVDFHNDKFTINDCALLSFPSDETSDKIKQEFKQLSY